MAVAVLTKDWWLIGGLHGWRRVTGLLRAQLASAPLWAHLHPADAPRLHVAAELANYRAATVEVRIGTLGSWVRCRLELDRWVNERCAITVAPLAPLPVSMWWLSDEAFLAAPLMPTTAEA